MFSHEAQANAPQRGNEQLRRSKQGPPARLPPVPTQQRSTVPHEMRQAVGTAVVSDQSGLTDVRSAPKKEKRVSKPVSKFQKVDPRQFELNQLRRRFSPGEREESGATALMFKLVPTDPDFPFEMTELQCTLRVPDSYPTSGHPSLRVTNPEMERGYQINVERGFESLVTTMPQSTLLGLINELDKRLEAFLMSEKAPTVKLVTNTGKKTSAMALRWTATPAIPVAASTTLISPPLLLLQQQQSLQQVAEARGKRESDIRQLEARMGRQPFFSKSPDNLSFQVPLQIPQSSKLPFPLQSITSVQLYVPLSYNLEPCSVSFMDVSSHEADTIRTAFKRHAKDHPELSLMAHINHLAQNIHIMAKEVSASAPKPSSLPPSPTLKDQWQMSKEDVAAPGPADKPHVHIIPRPPEWDISRKTNSHSDSSTDGLGDESSEYETDEEDGGATIPPEAHTTTDVGPDLGILLSFPSLELYGTELLQLHSISLTVKCDRCKEMKDVKSIRTHGPGDLSLIKHESCNKCASALSIGG
jgi:hypothetical protein